MAIDLTGITNENEFYTHHYLAAILEGDLKPLFRGMVTAGASAMGRSAGSGPSVPGDSARERPC